MRLVKLRLLWVVAAFALGFAAQTDLWSQAGPKPESGDTVARPKKKATTDEAVPPKEDVDQTKIPSKLGKKKSEDGSPIAGPTFRSDTTTVSVEVAVMDNRGRFIPNIPAGNFRILEDDVPQKLTGFNKSEAPMTIALVIEFSNLFQSYWSYGWQETLAACYGFLETLKKDDYVAVIAFDMRPEILSDFSTDKRAAYDAMSRLRIPAYHESCMYDALTDTAERMSDIEGRKAILYIGSGWDTLSKQTYDKSRRSLQAAGVPIYSISILQAAREMADARGQMGAVTRLDFLQADNTLRTYAKETGGQAYFPRFMGEYPNIFRAVADSLRNQYSLAYNPSNTVRDGKFRKIKVELVNPQTGEPLRIVDEKNKPIKYQIIAKAGYTAPREVE